MKLRTIAIAIALAGFAGVAAGGPEHVIMQPARTIELLSEATGLTVGEVKMALGAYANYEYPVRYASANLRFRQAVGRTLYEQIMGGGELNAQQVQNLIALAETRQAKLATGK